MVKIGIARAAEVVARETRVRKDWKSKIRKGEIRIWTSQIASNWKRTSKTRKIGKRKNWKRVSWAKETDRGKGTTWLGISRSWKLKAWETEDWEGTWGVIKKGIRTIEG